MTTTRMLEVLSCGVADLRADGNRRPTWQPVNGYSQASGAMLVTKTIKRAPLSPLPRHGSVNCFTVYRDLQCLDALLDQERKLFKIEARKEMEAATKVTFSSSCWFTFVF
jgi:hypothetical protein